MRTCTGLAVLAASLGLAGSSHAQSAPTFGGNNQPLEFRIVSTDPNASVGGQQIVPIGKDPQRFFNRNPGRISNQQVIGRSNFPTYAQLPDQDYLKAFRVQRHPRVGSTWYSWFWPF